MAAGPLIGQQSDEETEKPVSPSRQNPVLREYFHLFYLSTQSEEWRRSPEPTIEKFIDGQIDRFLQEVRKHIDRLKQDCETLRGLQEELELRPSNGAETEKRFREALESVHDDCGNLRGLLSRILRDLKSKSNFTPEISDRPFYAEEVGFILKRSQDAISRIEDYLFLVRPTVHISGLQNENMLIYLFQVQRMARAVQRDL